MSQPWHLYLIECWFHARWMPPGAESCSLPLQGLRGVGE